jgi:hypothetical protein
MFDREVGIKFSSAVCHGLLGVQYLPSSSLHPWVQLRPHRLLVQPCHISRTALSVKLSLLSHLLKRWPVVQYSYSWRNHPQCPCHPHHPHHPRLRSSNQDQSVLILLPLRHSSIQIVILMPSLFANAARMVISPSPRQVTLTKKPKLLS